MNSAAQVDNFFENWKREGWSKEELIVKCAEAELGWPYVWGAVGAQCTPSKREYYANRSSCPEAESAVTRQRCQVLSGKKSGCDGCEYFPGGARVLIDDCQGFVKQVMSRVGISFSGGGCTSMWNTAANWTQKGSIRDLPAGQVCCVFMQSGSKMEHIGIHVGQGQIIHCSGTVKRGMTTDRGWTHYAIPRGLGGDTPMPTHNTIRKGSTGPDVVECQEDLIKLGYDLGSYGADGKFGAKTESAVKQFQRDHGLKVDGIVGQATWTALDEAVGPTPTPVTKLYTVHIPHLTEYQAEGLIASYAGAWKTVEEG